MNMLPVCVLYTQDAALVRRVIGGLALLAEVRHIDEASRLETTLQPLDPALLIFDLCGDNAQTVLTRLVGSFPETVIVALGLARSEPALAAEQMGLFAVEDYGLDGRRLQRVVLQAHACRNLLQERRMLREKLAMPSAGGEFLPRPPSVRARIPPLWEHSDGLRSHRRKRLGVHESVPNRSLHRRER